MYFLLPLFDFFLGLSSEFGWLRLVLYIFEFSFSSRFSVVFLAKLRSIVNETEPI